MGTRALLVGINKYPGAALRGCIHDIEGMQDVLRSRYHLAAGDITVLTDANATMDNIVHAIEDLAKGTDTESDCVRLFHFSGHGSYVPDRNGDEEDGRDEGICPVDYATRGLLVDDKLRTLYAGFGRQAHLLLVMDSCHSGTVQRDPDRDAIPRTIRPSREVRLQCREARLKNEARRDESVREFVRGKVAALKNMASSDEMQTWVESWTNEALRRYQRRHYGLDTVKGNIVLLAGCRANQTSADAKFADGYQGAMSHYLLKALRAHPGTYGELIASVGKALEDDDFDQEPQLECSAEARGFTFLRR